MEKALYLLYPLTGGREEAKEPDNMSDWEIVNEEFACDHEMIEVRKILDGASVRTYVKQCVTCGHNFGAVAKKDVTGTLRMAEFDDHLRRRWQEAKQARFEELHDAKNREWWDEYNAYLESPQWEKRRQAVMDRDNGMCQGCRRRPATQVHHLTYERKCHEMLFDLVAVCELCHRLIHSKKDIQE